MADLAAEAARKLASGEWPSSVPVSLRQFYEQAVDQGWLIVTPDGLEATPEYERYNDGSPFT